MKLAFTQLPEPTERPTDIPVEVVNKNGLLVYSTGEFGEYDLGKRPLTKSLPI